MKRVIALFLILSSIPLFATLYLLDTFQIPNSKSEIPNPEGVFRMTLSSEPPTLDWSLATDNVSFDVITNIMEGLTQFDRNLNPQPAIAERWEISGNGKKITYYLKKDVRWTDGRPVTAYDFEYSWKRLLDPKTGAEYAYFLYDIVNAYEYNTGKIKNPDLIGIRVLGPTVLEVRLEKPVVYFPSITTFMVTFPQRKDLIEKYGDRWAEPGNIVTNGPFRLDKWFHEYKLVLKANETYYEGRPRLDEIRMFVVGESSTALSLYETGDIDMVNPPPVAIPAYKSHPEYVNFPHLRGYYYGFNITKRPFGDVRVRRAFSMAIDRREFPIILKGGEIPTSSWIPKGMFGYSANIGIRFDPLEARRLLADAGYPDGKGFPLVKAVFNTSPENQMIAENLQAQWKRNLNVEVTLDNQEWKVYLNTLKTDPPALFRLGWGADYPDPDNFMNLFTAESGNNHTRWGNRRYDELIKRASVEQDLNKRQAMYDEAQSILTEWEVPIMPLFIVAQNLLIKPYVKGLEINAMDILYLKKGWIVKS